MHRARSKGQIAEEALHDFSNQPHRVLVLLLTATATDAVRSLRQLQVRGMLLRVSKRRRACHGIYAGENVC